MFLLAIVPVWAQVEKYSTPTELDATWTEINEPVASYKGDLHLAGQSKVDFDLKNTTSTTNSNYSYLITISVRDQYGNTKVSGKYKFVCDYRGNKTWQNNNTGALLQSGDAASGSLSLTNGATGDYLHIAIARISGSGTLRSILTKVTSTTTRYDLYDDLPLFGTDNSATPTSNRIKDHVAPIDVYVHRTLIGQGAWSTLCLPFNLSHEQVIRSLGDNIVYSQFDNVDLAKGVVNFKSTIGGMVAGKPYLIQNNGPTINKFFADNVTFTRADVDYANQYGRKGANVSQGYYFVGLLEPTQVNLNEPVYNPNGRAVYVANPTVEGGDQELKRLTPDGTMRAFRAYLVYPQTAGVQGQTNDLRFISLDDALSDVTSITQVGVDGQAVSNRIYDLSGRFVGVDADQLSPGIYVRNGVKFAVN